MKLFGEFQLKVKNVVTGEETDTGWRPNLVLNNAFNEMRSPADNYSWGVHLGTGSLTPTLSDTLLETWLVAGAMGAPSSSKAGASTNFIDPIYSTSAGWEYTFPLGAVDGNVSEIGIGSNSSSSTPLTTRALITDALGNPTTITLGANDILTVNYRVGYEMDTSHPPGVSAVDFGVTIGVRDVTAKWVGLGNGAINTNTMNGQILPYMISSYTNTTISILSTLPSSPLTSMADAVSIYDNFNFYDYKDSITATGSSWVYSYTFTFGLGVATGEWVGIVIGGSSVSLEDKTVLFELSSPVTKAANQQFTITISYEIQRD